ncbi:girdin-like isoform X2 [Cololabis saira]|uniref:girdin-like isoform X2 n=1 Tax=Cololabis saira TaxID=129043 RepID=UPI002AD515EE|nr:girdin-like isoform X2 [Cololabis saira]
MESAVFLPSLHQFMRSPLVTWVKTFLPNDGGVHLDFSELLDGVFLNEIMTQIYPSSAHQHANKVCRDPSQRIHNLNRLVQQIKTYYLDNLRQLIMIPLPDVLLLGKNPYCEQSLDEMKKLLLLLLGCAVQCEKKEDYIERIQTLDFDTKAAIAVHIQELTHSPENVLDLQQLESTDMHPEEMEAAVRSMATHLRHLLDQKDTLLESIAELMQEKEGADSLCSSPSTPPSAQQQQVGTQQHMVVELADSKAKIRRLRQELEEKSELIVDCRHETENMEAELKRIQQENSQLHIDARAARTYRDELDALRERAIKADKLESEVGRYREQLHKMEFYKTKIEELKEDNRVLQETKEVLEDQLEGWRARTDKIHQLEKHSLLLKAQLHDMEQEREADRRRIEELQEENLALSVAQRRSMEESQHLGWELEQLSMTTENSQGQQTLSEEVTERTQSRMLKLEKENQTLLRTIEELRAASSNGSTKTKHRINNFTASTGESSGLQTSCSMVNGNSNCHQQVHAEHPEGVKSTILHTRHRDCHKQEDGELEDQCSGEHFNKMKLDLEVLENNHNRVHCLVGSRYHSSGSKSRSPCHDSVFTGAPTSSSYSSKHSQRLEAKCKALDTVNQQLQASLENTDRKVQRLEAEVQELEAENHSLQSSVEELRISAKRLEQLETEKQRLEHESATLERDKRHLEKENRRLRQQAEIQEVNLDSSNVCMATLEREMRLLVKEVEGLRETAERVKSLETENRQLAKQAAIDQRTLAALREELVSEKLKTQQRDNELKRLAHELDMKFLNQENRQQAEREPPENRVKMLELELEASLKKSLQIKNDKMATLQARLEESSSLNQQLRRELIAVKLSYEALQQQQEEEQPTSSFNPPTETSNAVTEWLRESQEATKELLKVKDHLIEVERNNATLEAERQAMQAQLKQLESQSDSQQAQILALQRQAASLQENNTALQTQNAKLQVEKSTLNSQSASLMAQNAQLQQQQSGTESERDGVIREREELRGAHEQLLRDHERLAVLHERQAMEYESLMGKHGCLKKVHRTLELEQRTLQDRNNGLIQQRTKLEDLEKTLKEEQMRMAVEREQHRTTAAECCRLRDEKDWLNQIYRQLLNDNEALTSDHKQLKSQLNETRLEHTWLEADFSELKKDFQQLDITSTKLTNQCELLSQLKEKLDEENHHLLSQIETLMLQNRTLLEQNMESKDLFHVEERQYIDKLNDLRRQKEKLEEKIMDQYKFYEPSPTRRRGNWITLKLKKLMKPSGRKQDSEFHSGAVEPRLSAHDSGSFISFEGSGGSASTSAGDSISHQRNSNKDSNDSTVPSGCEDNNELQNHGLNGVQSRPHSESSGEFNLSLENEPWSNGSSPIQQPPSRRSSSYQPPRDTSTPQRNSKLQQHTMKASGVFSPDSQSVQKRTQETWLTRGTKTIRKGSRGKVARRSSDLGGSGVKGITSKAENTQATVCSPITVLYVQGKSSSMSGCLNCFSTPLMKEGRLRGSKSPKSLPRASSVASTAEGSSQRPSSNCKDTVRIEPVQVSEEKCTREETLSPSHKPEPASKNCEPDPIPPVKPPREQAVIVLGENHKCPVQESLLGSSFTFNSVFSNTIFSDSVVTMTSLNMLNVDQTFLCSSPHESQESAENTSQTLFGSESQQNQDAEPTAGLEGTEPLLTSA